MKKRLIELLQDIDIRKIIKQISLEPQNIDEPPHEELEKLRYKNSELDDTVKKLTHNLSEITKENSYLKSINNDLNKTVDFYKNSFEKELQIFNVYKNLTQDTKESLSGIFKSETFIGFIVCGVQQNSIDSFWEYIKNELRDSKNRDIEKLITIFYFLFEKYTLAYPIYKLQTVDIGDIFDTQNHIRHNLSQNMSGAIQEILFYGIVNTKTNQIVKQSIVKI